MPTTKDLDYEIKRMEYRQKHGHLSKSGRAKLIKEMSTGVAQFNQALEAEKDKEAERHISNKNQELANFVFAKEAKGRTSVFIK